MSQIPRRPRDEEGGEGMTFLEFTFESGWHFAGMVYLIALGIKGIVLLARAIRGGK